MREPPQPPSLFFTAFEPSGDDHASVVIRELRRRWPDLPIHAWGGPKMAAAGARIIRETGDDSVMGLPGLGKINKHISYNRKIARWLEQNRIAVHVPVDSPAANFPICKLTRRAGAKVVHLVSPQVWAWATWRVRKLKRLTDHVLCVLPFEPEWLRARGVPATFIGHLSFDEPLDFSPAATQSEEFFEGAPRLALLPGSRPAEIRNNFPLLLEAFGRLKARRPGLSGVVAATNDGVAERLRVMANDLGGWPEGLGLVVHAVDAAARWCDVAVAASGTVTLQIARQRRPMVVVYRLGTFARVGFRLIIRWMMTSEHIALPNIVAGKRIIPELFPYTGDAGKLVREIERLLDDGAARERQRADLDAVCARFEGRRAANAAADAIEAAAGLRDSSFAHAELPVVRAGAAAPALRARAK
jgi:lipid-A-disaccharide synthase